MVIVMPCRLWVVRDGSSKPAALRKGFAIRLNSGVGWGHAVTGSVCLRVLVGASWALSVVVLIELLRGAIDHARANRHTSRLVNQNERTRGPVL